MMKKVKFEESDLMREIKEDEMEKIAAGWGFGACLVIGAACTTDDYEGVGVEVGVCLFFGAVA